MNIEELRKVERINVIGTSGSGKSTFAREIAKHLELPYFEMDAFHWKPNWTAATDEDFLHKIREITSKDRWVLDGNYTSRTAKIKWKRVELIIWLDMPFIQTVYRVTKRTIQRAMVNQEIWPGTGNRERFSNALFLRDSIIWWAITTHKKNRAKYSLIMADPEYSHLSFLRLRSSEEVNSILKCIQHGA